jgi:hypothetical protein
VRKHLPLLQGLELQEAASLPFLMPFSAVWHDIGTLSKNGLPTINRRIP